MTMKYNRIITLLLCVIVAACSSTTEPPDSTPIVNGKIHYMRLTASGQSTYVTDDTAAAPTLFLASAGIVSQPRNRQMLVIRTNPNGSAAGAAIVNDSGVALRELTLPQGTKVPVTLSPDGAVMFYSTTGSSD